MKTIQGKFLEVIKRAFNSPLAGSLIRFGYLIRGFLYVLFGFYGLEAAIGLSGNVHSTTEIVKVLGTLPLGSLVIILILIGLLGFGIWGLIRAVIDPLNKGSNLSGLIVRIGYLSSGLTYLALSLIPIHLLLNIAVTNTSNSASSAGTLLRIPGGLWLVAVIGLVIIAGGLGQIFYGFNEKFKKTLKPGKLGKQKGVVIAAGKYGYIARGIIFTLIGIFFFRAGISGNATQAKDPGEILIWAWQQSGGSALLGIISIGMIALGVYSIFAARAIRLTTNEKT